MAPKLYFEGVALGFIEGPTHPYLGMICCHCTNKFDGILFTQSTNCNHFENNSYDIINKYLNFFPTPFSILKGVVIAIPYLSIRMGATGQRYELWNSYDNREIDCQIQKWEILTNFNPFLKRKTIFLTT